MALDDLYKSLSIFQDGMQKLAINNGIQNATAEVDSLNSQAMDAMQRRQAQSQVAKNLSLQLTQAGATGQQIQTAMGAIAPPSINNSQDAYTQAVATNDPSLMKQAKDMQAFERGNQEALQKNSQDFTARENQLNRENALRLAGIRADGRGANTGGKKPAPTKLIENVQGIDDSLGEMSAIRASLSTMKDEIGPVAGIDVVKSWRDPKFADFKAQVGRWFDEYRKRITGAGAGEKEIKMLQANAPSVRDTPEAFEAKLNTMEKLAVQVRNRRLKTTAALYDVGDLAEIPEPGANTTVPSLPEGIPQGSTPVTVKDQNGKPVQGYKLPNGQIAVPE